MTLPGPSDRGNQTLNMDLYVRNLTDAQIRAIRVGVSEAVCAVTGQVPSMSWTVAPDYVGPGRTAEEAARAAREGRR